MNRYRIMIVDDEPDIVTLLEKALNIEGFDDGENHILSGIRVICKTIPKHSKRILKQMGCSGALGSL